VITQVKWSSDESKLYFTAQDQGGAPLFSYDLNSKELKQITSHLEGVLGFDLTSAGFVYAKRNCKTD
jgi:dipeptidyl aminopeptidase/acylaminoacyl peptidase